MNPPKKKEPPAPRTRDGQSFDWRVYAWIHEAIVGRATHFPMKRWVRALKSVESAAGKMAALRGWACYLCSTEAQYVSAQSFARTAGKWIVEAPDCPDDVFQSKQAVFDMFGAEEQITPPYWIVQRGAEAVKAWRNAEAQAPNEAR